MALLVGDVASVRREEDSSHVHSIPDKAMEWAAGKVAEEEHVEVSAQGSDAATVKSRRPNLTKVVLISIVAILLTLYAAFKCPDMSMFMVGFTFQFSRRQKMNLDRLENSMLLYVLFIILMIFLMDLVNWVIASCEEPVMVSDRKENAQGDVPCSRCPARTGDL